MSMPHVHWVEIILSYAYMVVNILILKSLGEMIFTAEILLTITQGNDHEWPNKNSRTYETEIDIT